MQWWISIDKSVLISHKLLETLILCSLYWTYCWNEAEALKIWVTAVSSVIARAQWSGNLIFQKPNIKREYQQSIQNRRSHTDIFIDCLQLYPDFSRPVAANLFSFMDQPGGGGWVSPWTCASTTCANGACTPTLVVHYLRGPVIKGSRPNSGPWLGVWGPLF